MVIEEEQGEFRNQKWKGNTKGLPEKYKKRIFLNIWYLPST